MANDIPVQDYLESAPITWDSTVNLTFLKKEEIFPLQNAAADELKDTIAKFYSNLKEFRAEFKQHAPFHFSGQPEVLDPLYTRSQPSNTHTTLTALSYAPPYTHTHTCPIPPTNTRTTLTSSYTLTHTH